MENEKNFAVYDYMCKSVKAHKQTEAVDMYEAFGWEATGAAASFGGVTVSFRRDRKIKHKTELNRLECKAENLKSLIDRITASMSFGAMIFAYIFGCLAALVFGGGLCMCLLNPGGVPLLVGGILLGLAGIALMSATYPIYKRLVAARTERLIPEREAAEEKLAVVCGQAHGLVAESV